MLAIDADDTIRQSISGDSIIKDPYDQQPIAGTIDLLRNIKKSGHSIYIVTNQGGRIEEGYKTLEKAIEEQRFTLQLFSTVTAVCMTESRDSSFFWYINRDGEQKVQGRLGIKAQKPSPGMLLYLETRFNRSKKAHWVIGKSDADQGAAESAGWNYLHIKEALKIGHLPD